MKRSHPFEMSELESLCFNALCDEDEQNGELDVRRLFQNAEHASWVRELENRVQSTRARSGR